MRKRSTIIAESDFEEEHVNHIVNTKSEDIKTGLYIDTTKEPKHVTIDTADNERKTIFDGVSYSDIQGGDFAKTVPPKGSRPNSKANSKP